MTIEKKTATYSFLLLILTSCIQAYTPGPEDSNWSINFGHINSTIDHLLLGDKCNDRNGKVSHLVWLTHSLPVVEFKRSTQLSQKVKSDLSMEFGGGGNHHMTDYDYVWPTLEDGYSSEIVDYDWQSQYEWTDRSIHPAVRSTFHLKINIGQEYSLIKKHSFHLSAVANMMFANMGWTGSGGSYKYWDRTTSPDGNGGYILNFDEGVLEDEKNISLRLLSATPLIGCKTSFDVKNTHFQLQALLGPSLWKMTDNHHSRSLRFTSYLGPSVFYSLNCSLRKNIRKNLSIVCQAEYNALALAKGVQHCTDTSDAKELGFNRQDPGLRFRSTKLSLGISYIA